jgi:hypothetical protein
MATPELLDPRVHAPLRLRAPSDKTPHFVQVVPAEFPAAAACSPVLFSKEAATGAFYAGAMFGFKPGECLLDTPERRVGFMPLMLQREGFFLSGPHIAIDATHERFTRGEGEPLFETSGEPGRGLRVVQRALGDLHAGLEQSRAFVGALTSIGLIEPVDISLAFDGGERISLQGLYTVSLDRLRAVDDAQALQLFRAGHLQLAHVMAASLRQIGRLARLRSQR